MNGAELDPIEPGQLYAETKRLQRMRMAQQIENDEEYPVDPVWQEDYMQERLLDLIDVNAIDPLEAQEVFRDWYNRRNPMIVVEFLGNAEIPRPFYE